MGRTYRKNSDNWEFLREKEERKREKNAKKRQFLEEPRKQPEDEDNEKYPRKRY